MAKKKRSRPKPDFHRQTVLFQWALAQFAVDDLKQFTERFQIGPDSAEGIDQHTGRHQFFEVIANALNTVTDDNVIPVDRLQAYEQNILEHTQAINAARMQHSQPRIDWKYHQYLALLFTEIFLDRYFDDPAALRDEINEQIATHNARAAEVDQVAPFPTKATADDPANPHEQLSRLAFWCATGSGKTLLMHVHVRQFLQYHQRAYQAGRWPKLDQIILVTPNDGLSRQHAEEFEQSGFQVAVFGERGPSELYEEQARKAIKILSIHKFKEDHGQATVATEAFEGCNLVLVDEGHRGAGAGGEGAWLSRRNQLADGGFTFEYSATFKEGIGKDDDLRNRYARSILFDYAYRSFYRDGYGKDFTILNLEDNQQQTRYLTAAMLLFYQQLKVWADGGEAIKPFQIDKPLWVFVGHTVTGGKVSSKADRDSVSDVVEVLLFLKYFLEERSDVIALITKLLSEGFVDHRGQNLLANRLPHLITSGDVPTLARELYEGTLRDVFHAPSGGGTLAVQMMRAAAGELAIKVGDAEPFGVVNVGDPGAVADACENNGITRLEDDVSRPSLFHGINRDDSTINMLVGSRKFTEGWNSWRVSSIGLMNMGKNEGTQIIQLFGRGVRLRGYRTSLRRSSVLAYKDLPQRPRNLRQVETLQVFGVKATYINTFRDWIFSEVPEAQERQIWELPVVKTLPKRKLKTLRLKEVIDGVKVDRGQAFRKLGPLVVLQPPDQQKPEHDWLRNNPTRLNWLPRIHGIAGAERKITAAVGEADELPTQSLTTIPIALFDIDALLFGLEAFKATRGLDRLHVDRAAIEKLLKDNSWYVLHAASDDMRLDRFENRAQWQRMAQQLLNNYAERFYRFTRGWWESPYMEVVDLTTDDANFPDQYSIETTDLVKNENDIDKIAGFVRNLQFTIAESPLEKLTYMKCFETVPFSGHLYQPLLYVGKNAVIRISPVPLNKWEAQFVEDLATWCKNNSGREVYLLRNQAVIGLGFFQAANFYPDFLLWVQDGQHQHLAFVDPKGLRHSDPLDPKIQFATRDIQQLQNIIARQCTDLTLHAFILSNTPLAGLRWPADQKRMTEEDFENHNILFQFGPYIGKVMSRILDQVPASA